MLGNLSKQSCESETALFRAVTSADKRALNIGGNNSSWRCEAKEILVPAFTCFIQGETRNMTVHCAAAGGTSGLSWLSPEVSRACARFEMIR